MGSLKHSSKASAAFSLTFYFWSMFALLSQFPRQKTGMKVTHVQPCTVTAQWQLGIRTTHMLVYTQTQHIYLFKEHLERIECACTEFHGVFQMHSAFSGIQLWKYWHFPGMVKSTPANKKISVSNHNSKIFLSIVFQKSYLFFFNIWQCNLGSFIFLKEYSAKYFSIVIMCLFRLQLMSFFPLNKHFF